MAGAAGWIWGAANVMPHECVRLWDLLAEGDHDGAMKLWAQMLPSNLFFWDNEHAAEDNSAAKTATNMSGAQSDPAGAP